MATYSKTTQQSQSDQFVLFQACYVALATRGAIEDKNSFSPLPFPFDMRMSWKRDYERWTPLLEESLFLRLKELPIKIQNFNLLKVGDKKIVPLLAFRFDLISKLHCLVVKWPSVSTNGIQINC